MTDDFNDRSDETFILPAGAVGAMDKIFGLFMAHFTPFGFQSRDQVIEYHPLPYKPEDGDTLLLKEPWRIELELYAGEHRMVVGLDLYGDVILGRGESRPGRIILDLEPYGAHQLGVSREHVMLRPTPNRLFAIDQGSTNGTTVNGAPSGRGTAAELHDQDLISVGSMVFMLHVRGHPSGV
jgi:hypothetical protein